MLRCLEWLKTYISHLNMKEDSGMFENNLSLALKTIRALFPLLRKYAKEVRSLLPVVTTEKFVVNEL
jgi:hypothetical protein